MNEQNEAKVIDMQAFRTRKTLVGDRKLGVQDTFRPTSSAPQRPGAQPRSNLPQRKNLAEPDLSDRIERIKSSIARINQLMTELRSMSSTDAGKRQ
jgi:hypothetical protein